MGVIISRLTRPIKSFNIENRAEKILNKPKPTASPPLPSTADLLKLSNEADPDFMKNHYKKDEELYGRLKHVFVSSNVQQVGETDETSKKPLPNTRTVDQEFDFGYWEPNDVSIGRCRLKTALQFITDHLNEPEKHSVESIAVQYQLEPKDVANILEYYRVYQIIKNDHKAQITDIRGIKKEEIADK